MIHPSASPAVSTALQGPSGTADVPRRLLWKLLQIPCRVLASLLFDLRTAGCRHIPARGPALLLSNHQSYLDPVLLAVHLRRSVSFMAKFELFSFPGFAWLIQSLNAFPIRRGASDIAAIREAFRRLREGRLLLLFPEGTRTRDGQIGSIQPGVAVLIQRARVPVIPAVIDGSFQAWPRAQRFFRPHPIRVLYGPAMHLEDLPPRLIVQRIEQTLRQMLQQLRSSPG